MRFLIENNGDLDLSKLADLFRQHGAVVTSSKARLSEALLANKKGLIIFGPFSRYSKGERDALVHFILEGGRLAIMLHIPMPVTSLLYRLNVIASRGIILEHNNIIGNNRTRFKTAFLFPHLVTKDLRQFSLYGTWALLNTRSNVELVAETSPQAWLDLNGNNKQESTEPAGTFAVLVAGRLGKGEYLVFGDDAIFQNRFLTDDNEKLAENLIAWLLR
ncbi:MAG: DUF4350 domain-containing protein [Deltaproteobacteria bacterium]